MVDTFNNIARLDFSQALYPDEPRLLHGFAEPQHVWQAFSAPELVQLLQKVELAAQQGMWCVGGLCYEAASALDPTLITHPTDEPLAWFAVYAQPLPAQPTKMPPAAVRGNLTWENAIDRHTFNAHLAHIHSAIAAGAYYQINYTQQLHGQAQQPIDGQELFRALQQVQPGGYAMYLDTGNTQIASVSPELFFDWHQPAAGSGHILTRPMKGTAARGLTKEQDAAQVQHLKTSSKERAENVMIVDLLRNDLGKIAQIGSVQALSLFNVQQLPTVWQMTSDVRAQLPQGTRLLSVLKALFPCGSVTGAPKRAAMQAIAALEKEPRGWYCGALGVVRSDGAGGVRATFNVPIRTVLTSGATPQNLRCGIGSGITADASAQGEWAEWQVKRAFVERVSMDFEIITTMALEDGVFRHLPQHMERLQAAGAHFGYPCNLQSLHTMLEQLQATYPSDGWRVRIALRQDGQLSSHVELAQPSPAHVVLQLAAEPLAEAGSEFVRFKTTRRAHYERLSPTRPGIFDTVLYNTAGEITECTRGNVAALLDGQWITPALSCGLLNGVGRQHALAQGRVVEGVIHTDDVHKVQQWAFINSFRGWLQAQVIAA